MSFLWNGLSLLMERGGPVMWPLLLLSVVSVTLTVERIWFWRKMGSRGSRVRLRAMINALRMNDAETVTALAESDDSPYGAVANDLACDGPSDAIAIAA
ncbi:MAG: hypothetical protein NTY97_10210, partial [Planctomycetota bacterium]|nr:hypothetical protein [Planctomycetota bacterium]